MSSIQHKTCARCNRSLHTLFFSLKRGSEEELVDVCRECKAEEKSKKAKKPCYIPDTTPFDF